MRNVMLDSGALIALFAPDDQHHAHFRPLVTQFAKVGGLRLVTTWPCVVEATHILQPLQRFEMLKWIELGGAAVYPFDTHHLGDMLQWMRRYTEPGKREMDFADASLYWLAVESGLSEIMTVDINDFSRYRLPDGRAFTIL
jgi:predicted nucleic acid-binding protein